MRIGRENQCGDAWYSSRLAHGNEGAEAVSVDATEMRVILEGARPYLVEVETVLRAQGITSEIVRPPGGCGTG